MKILNWKPFELISVKSAFDGRPAGHPRGHPCGHPGDGATDDDLIKV